MDDEDFMHAALELARQAEQAGEVPVGAVVKDRADQGHPLADLCQVSNKNPGSPAA